MKYGGVRGAIKAYVTAARWLHDGKRMEPSLFMTDEITPGTFRVTPVIIRNDTGLPVPDIGMCNFDQALQAWFVQFPDVDPIQVIQRDSEWIAGEYAPNDAHIDDVASDLLTDVDI